MKFLAPLKKDVVVPTVYDELGREAIRYLPYAAPTRDGEYKPNALAEQNTFNAGQFPDEQFYFGRTEFESSPLNRTTKTLAPGNSWVGSNRGVAMQYQVNTSADAVRIWSINASGEPVTSATYDPGTLYKNVTTDEHGKKVMEYKDKEGRVILKKVQLSDSPWENHSGWLCTYYIYDDLNQLRCVIQPKGVEELAKPAVNWNFNNAAGLH